MMHRRIPLYQRRQHELLEKMKRSKSYREFRTAERQLSRLRARNPYIDVGLKVAPGLGVTGGWIPAVAVGGGGFVAQYAANEYKAYKKKHRLLMSRRRRL
jgi:hypothetical protein